MEEKKRKCASHQSKINKHISTKISHWKCFYINPENPNFFLGHYGLLSSSSKTLWFYLVLKHCRSIFGYQSIVCHSWTATTTLIQFTLPGLELCCLCIILRYRAYFFMTWDSWCLQSWLLRHIMQPFPSKVLPPSEVAVTEHMWILLRGLTCLIPFSGCFSLSNASSLLPS